MIVDDIVREMYQMKRAAWQGRNARDAKFVVYIDNETFANMRSEMYGPVSIHCMEMIERHTIEGAPCFIVGRGPEDVTHGWKVYEIK